MRPALAAILTALAATLLLAFGAVDFLELPARDAVLRALPRRPASNTIIIAIDEQSIRDLGAWPWRRDVLARIVDRAADAGARAVVFDVLLTEPRDGDEELASAMKRLPSITVSVLDEKGGWLIPRPPIAGASTPAHGNFELDSDGILRRFASTKQSSDRSLTALPIEVASVVVPRRIPIGVSIAPSFRTPPRTIPRLRASAFLRDASLASQTRGKLVFIGPTAFALSDRVLTPLSRHRETDPGVTVHAAATESLIRGETIRTLPPIVSGLIAGVAVFVIARRRSIRVGVILAIVVLLGAVLALNAGIAVPFMTLIVTIVAATAFVHARRLSLSLEDLATRIAEVQAQEAESKRVLAHELKTPLASMRGLTQLLSGFELSEAERKRVATLLSTEAGKLEAMVHGLLDLERLPLRDFASSSSVVDLGGLVAARVDFLRASTDRALNASIENGLWVRADAALLDRVIDNLAGNAFKYSPEHTPVTIATRKIDGSAVLEVEDRGAGIAPDERERVFRRFARGSSAKGTEGLGLGLSLVAEVARWHGGSVSVGDAKGGGALFRVSLPLAAAMEERRWRASS